MMNPKRLLLAAVLGCAMLSGCGHGSMTASGRLDRALQQLSEASTEATRFYALGDVAKESFVAGHTDDAKKYATELLALAPRYRRNWNYGNAIQDGNIVLGRIAASEGRINDAKHFLEEAGKSPGSPQMNSFGPNMSLADDLLAKGEKDAVLAYFDACRKFWGRHADRLDAWAADVRAGRRPEFGANLIY